MKYGSSSGDPDSNRHLLGEKYKWKFNPVKNIKDGNRAIGVKQTMKLMDITLAIRPLRTAWTMVEYKKSANDDMIAL
ncbi:unnamed protein product [Microthlaspi erraticum]|uniref:NAC domain-containing protein n=1 Tax=Microthlaspi erraticum TaxID=1685480 RepID=A0A6D2HN39_9BRAS|nr:unnamed protein product [Microthlaspi erraticum]